MTAKPSNPIFGGVEKNFEGNARLWYRKRSRKLELKDGSLIATAYRTIQGKSDTRPTYTIDKSKYSVTMIWPYLPNSDE